MPAKAMESPTTNPVPAAHSMRPPDALPDPKLRAPRAELRGPPVHPATPLLPNSQSASPRPSPLPFARRRSSNPNEFGEGATRPTKQKKQKKSTDVHDLSRGGKDEDAAGSEKQRVKKQTNAGDDGDRVSSHGQHQANIISIRVQDMLSRLQGNLCNPNDPLISAEKQNERMDVILEVLVGINEAGHDVRKMQEVLLKQMTTLKHDRPLQRALFQVFNACTSLPSQVLRLK